MVCIRDGASAIRKGRSRPILSLKKGSNGSKKIAQLGGDEHDFHSVEQPENQCHLSPIDRFEAAVWEARNQWSIHRHVNGLAFDRRLSKRDADRELKRALKSVEVIRG